MWLPNFLIFHHKLGIVIAVACLITALPIIHFNRSASCKFNSSFWASVNPVGPAMVNSGAFGAFAVPSMYFSKATADAAKVNLS